MKTSDLCDKYGDTLRVMEPVGIQSFGGRTEFHGQIETVKCYENNTFVRAALEQDGTGKVLVVDGGGSTRCALLGDSMAGLARDNHWNGIILYGCIRDSLALSKIDIGILALGTNPQKSAKVKAGTPDIVVSFAGVDFVPGAFLYADEDGVLVSNRELALP